MSNPNVEEPTDDEWRSDLVRDFKKVGKSPISTPVDSETQRVWFCLGVAGPWILVFPLVYMQLMLIGYYNERITYLFTDRTRDIYAGTFSPSVPEFVVSTLVLLVGCAIPCLIGLQRYKNKMFALAFAAGVLFSFAGTGYFLAHKLIPAIVHPTF